MRVRMTATAFAVVLAALAAISAMAEIVITPADKAVLLDMLPEAKPKLHKPPPRVPDWILLERDHQEYTRWNCAPPTVLLFSE